MELISGFDPGGKRQLRGWIPTKQVFGVLIVLLRIKLILMIRLIFSFDDFKKISEAYGLTHICLR